MLSHLSLAAILLTFTLAPMLIAETLHPSMLRVDIKTASSFRVSDPKLQRLYDTGMDQAKSNLVEFNPGMTILVEGGGYNNAWLETQPMGGEMYAKHHLQAALNNQVLFIRAQRDDGRLPGMVVPETLIDVSGWDKKGFPAGYVWKPKHNLVADYEMFQGYCFPEPAWRMYFWSGKNREYLKELETALKGHDAYLWRRRDSNNDGLLETWCIWDTGEDRCTRLHERGAQDNWPFEEPPGSNAPGVPKLPEGARIPFQSMDVMAYSYSGRAVLAKIAKELDTGEEEKWTKAAEEVRRRVVEKLWDPERHACFDRDRDGKVLDELIHNNLRCMWYGLFTQEMADAFIRHHLLNPEEFWTPVPLVSIARNEPLFQSVPRNNWSGQPQGLTYQRAIGALERYGHLAEITLLGRKLFPVLVQNNYQFSQQLDPDTGKPSESNGNYYGPMILAMEGYLTRMHGIHLAVENGQVWWSGLEPKGGQFGYTQQWGEYQLELVAEKGRFSGKINGKLAFNSQMGCRVVTDLNGNLLSVVGIDTVNQKVDIQQGDRQWSGNISPNHVMSFGETSLTKEHSVPFDYPYQPPVK